MEMVYGFGEGGGGGRVLTKAHPTLTDHQRSLTDIKQEIFKFCELLIYGTMSFCLSDWMNSCSLRLDICSDGIQQRKPTAFGLRVNPRFLQLDADSFTSLEFRISFFYVEPLLLSF